jgi:predicted RNA-binding protein with EMAP domain
MDYKTKYLKYKTKYFNLKNEMEMEGGNSIVEGIKGIAGVVAGVVTGTVKGAQFLGRAIKKTYKGTKKIQQEITEINNIVKKLKGHSDYPKNIAGDKINVESFLKFIKKLRDNFNTEKIGEVNLSSIVKLADLNLILGKHYLCKTMQILEYYDNTNCELNKQTNT